MTALCEVRGEDPAALATLSLGVERELAALGAAVRAVAFACIGTDGRPATRSARSSASGCAAGVPRRRVIGTLEEPFHALNLASGSAPSQERPRPLIVAVNAALGPASGVGTRSRSAASGLLPGQGVGKDLPRSASWRDRHGERAGGRLDAQVLQSTRLFVVQELAETIGTACWWALRNVRRAARAMDEVPSSQLRVA